MDMVDVVITRTGLSGCKSGSTSKQFLAAVDFGTSVMTVPRGSHPEKMNPPLWADLSISPFGVYYDM